jgi:hypothetical protein
VACGDPGSVDLVAEGVKLDGRNETHVVAKIAQGSQPEKEAYMCVSTFRVYQGAS